MLETCSIPDGELPGLTAAGRPVVAVSYYRRGSPLRAVHQAAKYGQDIGCARWLGRYVFKRIRKPLLAESCCVVTVPSHPARLRERGLDVVDVMAHELAKGIRATVTPLLRRTRLGSPQSHLDRDGRVSNVDGVFQLSQEPERQSNGPILLLDDVTTTGATLDACAEVLESIGSEVMLLALAFRRELFAMPRPSAS